ncbi:MAG: hypothetical protein JWN65_973 [Solirubrobacterales bacterium]|nr:hypothetical protein [Solirubrobacterales bacterium]
MRDHAYRSLALLLRVHRERRTPVLIATTGAFLSLCQRDAPDVVEDLVDLYQSGIAEPATTYFHDTDPFSIRWVHLREQVRRDHEFKSALIGREPEWFFAPSFAWHPALDGILTAMGISGLVLDSRHLASAATARAWQWSREASGAVAAVDTAPSVSPWEHRRVRVLARGNAPAFRVVFRDWPLTQALTFGNEAEIHLVQRHMSTRLAGCADDDLVVLADDGDRIAPASRRGYEELLDAFDHVPAWSDLAVEASNLPSLRELPAFSQPGFDELLRTSLEGRMYWSLIDEIASAELDETQLSRLLALQDVFYPFWKGCGRRTWYIDEAVSLLEELRPGRA